MRNSMQGSRLPFVLGITGAVMLGATGCFSSSSSSGGSSSQDDSEGVAFHVLFADYGVGAFPANGDGGAGVFLETGLQRPERTLIQADANGTGTATAEGLCVSSTLSLRIDGDSEDFLLENGPRTGCLDEDLELEAMVEADATVIQFPGLELPDFGLMGDPYSLSLARIGTAETDGQGDFASGSVLLDLEGGGLDTSLYSHVIAARQSEGFSAEDLAGGWGFVRLEINTGGVDTLYSANALSVELDANSADSVDVSFSNSTEVELIHFPDAGDGIQGRFFNQINEEDEFPISVMANGELALEDFLTGFAAPDGNFFLLSRATPTVEDVRAGDAEVPDDFVDHQWLWAVRRSETPLADVAGRSYRLEGPAFFAAEGQFEMTPLAESASIAFNDAGDEATAFDFAVDSRLVEFNDNGGVDEDTGIFSTLAELPFTVGVGDAEDGRAGMLELITTDPRNSGNNADGEFLTGFVQAGGDLLLLIYGDTALDNGFQCVDFGTDPDDCRFAASEGSIAVLFGLCEEGCSEAP